MEFIISRYNQDINWLGKYTPSAIIYDRSENPLPGTIMVPNLGSDILDKLHFIISNYNNLPEVAVYTKANIFKFISEPEFDAIVNNKEFTPILTFNHEQKPGVSFYLNGIYWEINNLWYLGSHPCKFDPKEIQKELGIDKMDFVPFAPGSGYILTRENIRRHPIEKYIKLHSYLTWAVYPGEAQVIERGLYTLWKP